MRWVIIRENGELYGTGGWGGEPTLAWGDQSSAMNVCMALGEGRVRLDTYQYPAKY